MPFINLSDISPQPLSQQIETFKIKELASLFTRGEILDAVVGEKLSDQKVILVMKNQHIIADSEVSLREGEKIAVKVDQLQPKVVLRIMSNDQAEAGQLRDLAPLKEYLLLHRSNPEALKEMIIEARDILTPQLWDELSQSLNKEDIKIILKSFQDIVFTKASANEPDFVKDYVSKLGLVLENDLMRLLKEQGDVLQGKPLKNKEAPEKGTSGDAGPIKNAGDNLKGQLMKLSEEIGQIFEQGDIKDSKITQQLTRLNDFTNHAVKSLESQQVVNVLLQETDGRFMLQIPLQFQEGIRMAEVYVEKDRDPGKKDADRRSYRVVFFLDMDAIGSIMVDASIREQNISCVVKCESEPVRDFAIGHLASLEDRLIAQGYQIDFLTCSLEKSIAEERHEYVNSQNLYADNVVNVFA
jgi:hypothetical protein